MSDKNEENQCPSEGCASCAGCGAASQDDFDPIITLTDEEGKDIQFEIIDVVVLEDDKQYLIVTEAGKEEEKNDDDIEVTILEIKEEDGDEVYDTVTDKDIAEKVFKKFQEQQEQLADESEDDKLEEDKKD